MASPVIQFKRGVIANLPALRAGEPGFTTDSYDLYVGIDSTTNNNKYLGSARYWTKETASSATVLKLLEASGNGTSNIGLRAPASVGSDLTYTLPGTATDGYFLKTDATGTLSWTGTIVAAGDDHDLAGTTDLDEVSVSGFSTFSKNVDVAGITSTQDLYVAGISTFVGACTFKGGTVTLGDATTDSVVFSADVNSNIIPNIDDTYDLGSSSQQWRDLFINGTVDADSLVVSGVSTLGGFVDINDSVNISDGLEVTGFSTFTKFVDINESVDIAGGVTVTGLSTFSSNVDVNSDVDINRSLAVTGGATVTGLSTFSSNVDINSDVDINRSLAVTGGATVSGFSTFTKFVDINESADISGGLNVAGITSAPTAVVTTLQASNIKANDGTTAMTITDSTGAVEFAQNLTIGGNMYVNGSTTQVNTSQTTIEDQLLELGMVDGSAPGSDLNKDIGVLFNYYTDAAKKAGVYWDDSTGRIVAASVVTESTGVLSASSYADFEVGGLFVSGCTGSATQIINCSSSTVILENITIDGGGF